ncbi:hypothetical protein [Actinoplanes sp. L3-i22]|uniref:hypothetical protein n=1 Tax=Actinoplanes sp. L3-i22 TaxID=2836373 RepID=UPI001C751A13|nr:hypothetical protein [Actinoplanes sp. L3-i22]BCY12567.1 hypothetical protein L3i22_076550 [Actinoplanes sp. L3-i22]
MIANLEPPAERDLPPARAARMRATLLSAAKPKTRRWVRLAVAASLTAAVAVAIAGVRPQRLPTTLALGPDQLSSTLEAVVDHCLGQRYDLAERTAVADIPVVTARDVAVAAESRGQAIALFVTDQGFFACTLDQIVRPIIGVRIQAGGGLTGGGWNGGRDWLPGPVQVLMSGAAVPETGPAEMSLVGRVSSRVARLVAEDGTHTVEARLANGMFGLLAGTDEVAYAGQLVAYDAGGAEISREPMFPQATDDRCWTGPDGAILYPDPSYPGPAGRCLPAEPWGH